MNNFFRLIGRVLFTLKKFFLNKRRRTAALITAAVVFLFALWCAKDIIFKPFNNSSLTNSSSGNAKSVYYDRFMELFNDIQKKGYLSSDGVPYHSLETFIVEAPDYGHLSTSEAFSYLTWLGATYGRLSGDWTYYKDAWDKTEKYIIPDPSKDQPGANTYPPSKPAQYAPESGKPSDYPVAGGENAPTGTDPIADELAAAYGSKSIYQMHWLLDVDNWYKYGNHGDGTSKNSYINTYQRGPEESVWETVPHPSWESFNWGAKDKGGFLSLFGKFGTPSKQWRYSSASDADGRQIQASYWAYQWAKEQGKESDIAAYSEKAAKMGDYLRYTFFDKYFRPIGVQNGSKAGTGYDSCHYLMSWYLSWGGDINGTWSWRIGSSHCHQGYQNVVAAYALSNESSLKPKSAKGQEDWKKSLQRQIELYQYLQSSEGAIAGGVTNSWKGNYSEYPSGASTFYDMVYDPQPVYCDPPSNQWFGFQAWSMERVLEYYSLTGDISIKDLCDKWIKWAADNTKLKSDGTYEIPGDLEWSGQPDKWSGKPSKNAELHCKVKNWTNDVGVTAALAKTYIFYAAACEKYKAEDKIGAKKLAKELLDRMWDKYRDENGIAVPEKRSDYKRFFDEVYIPKDFEGKNAQGADLKNGAKFIDIRPEYKKDPEFKKLEDTLKKGGTFEIKYHRFWAQADIAIANAMYYIYFEGGKEVKSEVKTSGEEISGTGQFNYGEALQKAIFFYDCQRSGKLDPAKNRVNWRGDSGLTDGKDVGLDLTGGWYDAGDNVKFGLPMAYTASMLGWSVYEYKDAFKKSGQLNYMLDNIKWATDYFIKCHPKPDVFYYQVGDGNKDHSWWGPAEAMQMGRPSYKVDKSNPGSAVTGETAAALAVASIIFKDTDKAYSEKCLKHAKELFDFSESSKSDAGYTAANGFYKSWSGFYDELSWASAWLYLATNDSSYLKKAEEYSKSWNTESQTSTIAYKWTQNWDDVHYGAQLLLARIDKNNKLYKESMERYLDYWAEGYNGQKIKYTPKGLAFADKWGSLRYATTTAFLAFLYSDWEGCDKTKSEGYKKFGEQQINYALGSTGRSFIVGVGKNSPQHPHHRTAQGSWADNMNVPAKHRHVLYGALVGGPGEDDSYKDEVNDYVANEVACDYNAGLIGGLARMYLQNGGKVIPDFKANEKKGDEFYVEAGVNASGSDFVEIKAVLNNTSGWPARASSNLSFKYFMDLSELKASGHSPSDIKVNLNYNQGAKVSEIKNYKGDIYYLTVDFTGTNIYPGGQSAYKKEVQFRITGAGNNFENDYSYKGLTKGAASKSIYIPVYDAGVKVGGYEPGESIKKADDEPKETSKTDETPDKSSSPAGDSTSNKPSEDNKGDAGGVKLLSYNTNTSDSTNSIAPKFKILNSGGASIKLSSVKIRYYYTIDGDKKQNFWCDWSNVGNSNITASFLKGKSDKADYYVEIGFADGAGTLESGKSVELQTRFAKDDWSNYTQTGDYSFNSSASDYSDNKNITMYIGGKLVCGTEP